MTYNDITIEQARKICKKIPSKKNPFNSKKAIKCCEKCPLRRERVDTDEEGNKRIILQFCTFVLLPMFDESQEEEKRILLYEKIEHDDELEKILKTLETVE